MKRLARKQILAMHTELIAEHGGMDGLRDEALFESALEAPFHGFGGQELFPTVQRKAVRLGYGLIKNHPFVDGNKRIGAHAMLVTLANNGIQLGYTQAELQRAILDVASGEASFDELLAWVLAHEINH
jgi:death on curing protein